MGICILAFWGGTAASDLQRCLVLAEPRNDVGLVELNIEEVGSGGFDSWDSCNGALIWPAVRVTIVFGVEDPVVGPCPNTTLHGLSRSGSTEN
jgi:hypothetical protein